MDRRLPLTPAQNSGAPCVSLRVPCPVGKGPQLGMFSAPTAQSHRRLPGAMSLAAQFTERACPTCSNLAIASSYPACHVAPYNRARQEAPVPQSQRKVRSFIRLSLADACDVAPIRPILRVPSATSAPPRSRRRVVVVQQPPSVPICAYLWQIPVTPITLSS